jgi:hypothetical protein
MTIWSSRNGRWSLMEFFFLRAWDVRYVWRGGELALGMHKRHGRQIRQTPLWMLDTSLLKL